MCVSCSASGPFDDPVEEAAAGGNDLAPTTAGNLTTETRSAAAEWIGTEIPLAATDLRYEEVAGGIDDAAHIRFDLPAPDLESFLATLELGADLWPGEHGVQRLSAPEWMDTSALSDFVGGSSSGRMPAVQVTIDVSDPDTVTVYIFAFQT